MSWSRSRVVLGDVDRPAAEYVERPPVDTVLTRAARPVLAALAAEIENEPVSLILTDATGVVLWRRSGDRGLLTTLDRVDLAPGFRYAETQVGTNGIGTALEVGVPVLVDGSQHFSGQLRSFSCAGAPVTHPITGAILGVVDLTTRAQHSNSLLLSFAKLAAARISERILEDAHELDRAVLNDYRAACQHSGRPVIAIGEEVLMINALTQQQFDAGDQMAIIEHARDARGVAKPFSTLTDLPSGTTARLSYEPTFAGDKLAGGIVRIKAQVSATTRSPLGAGRAPALRTIAGSSAVWRHTAQGVIDACKRREWLVLDGEPGVGKAALIRAVHQNVWAGHRLALLDAAELDSNELLDRAASEFDSGSDLAILHADVLHEPELVELTHVLQAAPPGPLARDPWVSLTRHPQAVDTSSLLRLFPKSISVPPLRYHLEDIPDLVRVLLDAAGATDLVLAPAALNQLMRLAWRGNVTQLRDVLEEVHRHRRSGVIEPEALPAECRATTRHNLTRMQALERDAIVDAIALHAGDKTAAAAALGMSRATIYRKIREFGIV
ncbi:sigma-54-dependent Fis family transcriptional regulator [Rhodococcus sp. TAF43]|uniref:sigma-54-dependent Fis family transcriptional regulator n=1 Tax=Rhodococcus sp. TAF43 TaxID=3237483 RepID=UPI003F9E77D7